MKAELEDAWTFLHEALNGNITLTGDNSKLKGKLATLGDKVKDLQAKVSDVEVGDKVKHLG